MVLSRYFAVRAMLVAITLLVAIGARAIAADESASEKKTPRWNVLFIATDDWRPEIACYGTTAIKTPNVDKLAARGVRFDRAYCQFPLCNPSRSSLLTGRYPTTTGVLDNIVFFRDAHPDWVTLPQHFKSQGYAVARTGKIFHGGMDDPKAWAETLDGRSGKKCGTGGGKSPTNVTAAPANAGQARPAKKGYDPALSDRIVVLDGDGESHQDFDVAVHGIELLEKYCDQPFFIAVGFHKPHSPPTAPKRFFDLYDPADMQLPADFAPRPTVPDGFPAASVPPRNGDLFINRDATPEAAREMIRAYHASASWVDWNIGRVLDALDQLKLADNTIIVFFGDHGYHLGEKGKWSKHGSLFEVGARVPLIICLPGANGQVCKRTVEFVDLYPTLTELCGLPQPAGLEGQSLAPLLADPQAAWSHPALTVANSRSGLGKSIRTERWRYSEWDDGRAGAVLFDHDQDPHEMKNLAADPRYAETVTELKSQLTRNLPARSP